MNNEAKRIALAELNGFVWYKNRSTDYQLKTIWGVSRLAYPPEEGVGKAWIGQMGESRFCTPEEIEEAKRTGWFYTYAPDYLNDLNAIARIENLLTSTQEAAYYGELHRVLYRGHMSLRHQQLLPLIRATAAQRADALLKATGKWQDPSL